MNSRNNSVLEWFAWLGSAFIIIMELAGMVVGIDWMNVVGLLLAITVFILLTINIFK